MFVFGRQYSSIERQPKVKLNSSDSLRISRANFCLDGILKFLLHRNLEYFHERNDALRPLESVAWIYVMLYFILFFLPAVKSPFFLLPTYFNILAKKGDNLKSTRASKMIIAFSEREHTERYRAEAVEVKGKNVLRTKN